MNQLTPRLQCDLIVTSSETRESRFRSNRRGGGGDDRIMCHLRDSEGRPDLDPRVGKGVVFSLSNNTCSKSTSSDGFDF